MQALPKALSRPDARFVFQPTSLRARTLEALLALRGGGRGNAAAGGWSVFADGSVEGTPLEAAPRQNPLKRKSRAAFAASGTTHPDASRPASRTAAAAAAAAAAAHDKENIGPRTRAVAGTAGTAGMTDAAGADDHADTDATKPRAQDRRQSPRQRRSLIATARFGSSAVEGDGKGIERLEIRLEDVFLPGSGRSGPTTTTTTMATTMSPSTALQERHLNQPDTSSPSMALATSLAAPSASHVAPTDPSFATGAGGGGAPSGVASSTIVPGDVVGREGQGPLDQLFSAPPLPTPSLGANVSDPDVNVFDLPDPHPTLPNPDPDVSSLANPDRDVPPAPNTARALPKIRLVFHGSHIFAGVRRLVETGFVDGADMPGWLTGEDGVSVGVVRGGRMLRGTAY